MHDSATATTPPIAADHHQAFVQAVQAAWRRELPLVPMLEAAGRLAQQGYDALAAVLYRTWLERNRTPHDHLVLFNLGVLLFAQDDLHGAHAAYSRALHLAPDFLQPRFNLGLTCERLGDSDAAVAQWLGVEARARADDANERPLLLLALNNLGRHLEDAGRYAEAEAFLTRSLRLEPMQPDVIHHWVFLRAKQCQWPVYQPLPGLPEDVMRQFTSALAMISQSEDPGEQLAAARQYVKHKVHTDVPRLAPARSYGHRKLRVAYCSGDFCLHPVAMLTAELFELHDRERFEIWGFDWSREDGTALRQRVIGAMDHFERIHALDDASAARLIASREIDILVDLQGQTLGARANMLALRPAPIQLTWLGLPATTGMPFIDHVIADRFLIPEDAQRFYSEKVLYLPDVYQPSDRQRVHSVPPARAQCGLPEHAFVFCSFNNNYKITPAVFDAWMAILARVPGSVLWLLADNTWSQRNLQREAIARGIDADRIVFAGRALPPDYLARYAVADLFLDCTPFNGGTTANDALWMGLPVLTCAGRTFASRMAGALLMAAGLPELITTDLSMYVDCAVRLANTPGECERLRAHLMRQRTQGVLFDTPRMARALEAQYERLAADLG
jgi:predicted O-linked N-acetylglucosamine transferase (SPINDLY family)